MSSFGVFLGNSIVASPIPNAELLRIHADFHQAIGSTDTVPPWLLTGRWVPHIAIVMPYVRNDIQRIFDYLADNLSTFEGSAIGIYVENSESEQHPSSHERYLFL